MNRTQKLLFIIVVIEKKRLRIPRSQFAKFCDLWPQTERTKIKNLQDRLLYYLIDFIPTSAY